MEMRDILVAMAIRHDGDFEKIYNDINLGKHYDPHEVKQLKENIKYPYVTIIDSNYPEPLKEKNCPPYVLFYEGNLNLINKKNPYKAFSENGVTRVVTSVNPIYTQNERVFDYVVACEKHDEVKKMSDHIKSKGIKLKNYDKKDKSRER